jgi:hypothetical protein
MQQRPAPAPAPPPWITHAALPACSANRARTAARGQIGGDHRSAFEAAGDVVLRSPPPLLREQSVSSAIAATTGTTSKPPSSFER